MNWKRIGGIALVAFLLYFLVKSPVESAVTVKNLAAQIADIAEALATSLTTFLRTLF